MSQTQDAAALLSRFGLNSFRPGQRDVIEAVLGDENCVCIMPTGGGKSLCYQLPAIMREGVTLVVSPLIALMKDQVDALEKLGLHAACINSALSPAEQAERIRQMQAGDLDLLYIAPERFRSPRFVEALRHTKIQLLAIDEAHCISEWGHDFRPDYARLGWFRQRVGEPTTIALTATATPTVRDDIIKQLQLDSPRIFMAGFSRPNLRFEVTHARSNKEKDAKLLAFLKQTPGCGIVYTSSRKRCEEVAGLVSSTGRKAGVYHAGLLPEDRKKAQERFMLGRTEIVVATVAFGMGIDKADVRFVVHYNMPGSIEAYYQEAGRAGRDGDPSRCSLIYTATDRHIQEYFIDNAYPPREVVEHVYDYLCQLRDDPIERTQMEIKEELNLSIGGEGVGACLQMLHKAKAIERLEPLQNRAIVRLNSETQNLVDLLPGTAKSQRKVLSVLERIVGDRRFEDVYLQPRSLLEATGMDMSALNRALRELRKLEAFDYIPPFRGRALRICEPRRRFAELPIDFQAYEERKQADYAKLDEMVAYASTRQCRQLQILRYFGDEHPHPCGNCDRCDSGAKHESSATSAASDQTQGNLLHTVRIALAGVARTEGRAGRNLVAQMLAGSKASIISKLKLQQLSTYGLLQHLKQSDVTTLLDALITARLVEQEEVQRYRPVLKLTDAGRDVMNQKRELTTPIDLPRDVMQAIQWHTFKDAAPSSQPSVDSNHSTTSPEEIPPDELVSPDSVEPVDYVSQTSQYESFDQQAVERTRNRDIRIDDSHVTTEHDANQPAYYWTWRLLSAGFRLAECAEIRRCSTEQILEEAAQAVENNLTIDLKWLFTPEQITAMEDQDEPSGGDKTGVARRLWKMCRHGTTV